MIGKALLFLSLGIAAVAQSVSDAALQEIKVTSGRSYAMMQFNMLAVRVWLPRLTNSAYAKEEFSKPQLTDAQGQAVPFELQKGLYDHDKWENEIRLTPKAEAARIAGAIRVRYPTRLRLARDDDAKDKITQPATFVKLPAAVVEEWKNVEITYDLPVLPKLPETQRGDVVPLPKSISPTPGGKVTVRVE